MNRQGPARIRALLDKHGVRPKKAMGQHFLADPNIVDRIVRMAGVGAGDSVLEVGAGTGTLTQALAATGARVVAYELDPALVALLDVELAGSGVEVREGDVMAVDLAAELEPGPWVLVANLPFHVGTPLVLDLLREVPTIQRFVVMLQQEVAQRLVAAPGTRAYGMPSVITQLRSEARIGFSVPPHVFVPAPEVASAVVELSRIEVDPSATAAEALAAVAFRQRRKMLRRSLADVFGDTERVLASAGIDPTARPEDVEPDRWLRLAAVAAEQP